MRNSTPSVHEIHAHAHAIKDGSDQHLVEKLVFYTSSLPLWLTGFKMLNLQRGQVALMCNHLSMQMQWKW